MTRRDIQRAVLASEFYWFGSELGAPKAFDSGTNFSAPPILRGSTADDIFSGEPAAAGRSVRYTSTADGWDVVFDER